MISAVAVGCGGTHRAPAGSSPVTDGSGLPVNQPVTRSDLLRFPAARLHFPGAVTVKVVGADQTSTHPGEEPNPAFAGAVFTAATTPDVLYGWYGSVLGKRGFIPTPDFRPADQTSGRAWQSHLRLEVQVGVFDPSLLRRDAGVVVHVAPGQIAFEAVVVGYPPGLPKY